MSPSRSRSRHTFRPLLIAAATVALALVPAAADAATTVSGVSVVNGDVVVDKPPVITVTGQTSSKGYVLLKLNAPGIVCAPTAGTDSGDSLGSATPEAGAFPGGVNITADTVDAAGTYTLCVYAIDYAGSFVQADLQPVSGPFVVRDPQTSLTMDFPARAKANVDVPLTLTTFAEVGREVNVELNVAGVPCGPNVSADQAVGHVVYERDILGGPTVSTSNVHTPSDNGSYHLCGYIGRSRDDASPLKVVDSSPFTVGPIPAPKCTVSPTRLTRKGTVKVSCNALVTGQIAIVATRGKKVTTVTRTIVHGKTKASAKKLHLAKGKTKIAVVFKSRRIATKTVKRR